MTHDPLRGESRPSVRLSATVITPPDDRSPFAVASHWVSRVIAVSLEMVVPGLVGLWVDSRLGTKGLLAVIGFVVGSVAAFWHLLRMTSSRSRSGPDRHVSQKSGER